ncbi:MAG: hypothetical protein Ct9H90mP27_4660 [Gammaproteobacteria bacterium]|nr:MAG: hypothetical protein Ct9H90mP27_4660 [Gammaproteobacteria bacterium]
MKSQTAVLSNLELPVDLAYVDQSRDELDSKATVWEEISNKQDIIQIDKHQIHSRAYVGRFNFKGTDQQKFVGDLSGGREIEFI